MGSYAVVNSEGIITNIVVWDGQSDWASPEGTIVVDCGDNTCQIGGRYKDGLFDAAPVPVPSHDELVNEAEKHKTYLLKEANTYTGPWQTQLLLGIISDAAKASLTTWMKYYQQVQAINTDVPDQIVWPTIPESKGDI